MKRVTGSAPLIALLAGVHIHRSHGEARSRGGYEEPFARRRAPPHGMRQSRAYILPMHKTCLALVVATLIVTRPGAARAQSPEAERAVIAIADSALAAITRGDAVALTDLMIPEGVLYPTSTREGVTTYRMRTREAQRGAVIAGVVERGFSPKVMVSGGVAMVWMPYDLYRNGAWSHCGVDVFTLVRSGGVWRIASMAWSAEQPPVCEGHPAGPPPSR